MAATVQLRGPGSFISRTTRHDIGIKQFLDITPDYPISGDNEPRHQHSLPLIVGIANFYEVYRLDKN